MESKVLYLEELYYKNLLFVNNRVLPYDDYFDLEYYTKVKTIRRDVREELKRLYRMRDADYFAIVFETEGEPWYMFRNENADNEDVLVFRLQRTCASRIYHRTCPYAKYGYLGLAALGVYGIYKYMY